MADDEERDLPQHAADEPTAMWGRDALKELGLDKPPSEPPPAATKKAEPPGSESRVQVSMGTAEAPHRPAGKPRSSIQGGSVLTWVATLVGAIALAAVTYFVVRWMR